MRQPSAHKSASSSKEWAQHNNRIKNTNTFILLQTTAFQVARWRCHPLTQKNRLACPHRGITPCFSAHISSGLAASPANTHMQQQETHHQIDSTTSATSGVAVTVAPQLLPGSLLFCNVDKVLNPSGCFHLTALTLQAALLYKPVREWMQSAHSAPLSAGAQRQTAERGKHDKQSYAHQPSCSRPPSRGSLE